MMDPDPILEAAYASFVRYGMRKTTMADVARAAGVSRQTVYNSYAGKTDVMLATVAYVAARSLAAAEAEWATVEGLGAKLEVFFNHAPLAWFDAIQQTPDFMDILDGIGPRATEGVVEAERNWEAALVRMLTPYASAFEGRATTVPAVAELVYSTSSTSKHAATTRKQLEARLATLKAAVLALAS